jgi:hypothetical protein
VGKSIPVLTVLIDVSYSYQTKLEELSEEEALKLVETVIINGREGFFCIKSSEDLTLQQAFIGHRLRNDIVSTNIVLGITSNFYKFSFFI